MEMSLNFSIDSRWDGLCVQKKGAIQTVEESDYFIFQKLGWTTFGVAKRSVKETK